jgi:phage gp29-like protein
MPFSLVLPKGSYYRQVEFTPAYLENAVNHALNGDWSQIHEMMDQMSTDAYVQGCLSSRRSGVMRDFQIMPPTDDDIDIERAAIVKADIQRLKPRKYFKAIQDGLFYKWNVMDYNWEVVDGRQVPIEYISYPKHLFAIDSNDGLLKINVTRTLQDIPPTATVAMSDGMPVLLPVLFEYFMRKFVTERWAAFLERFGEPFIIGVYQPGASDELKDELEEAVSTIASAASGIMPHGGAQKVIEILESAKTTGDHENFEKKRNAAISVGILGHEHAVADATGLQVGNNPTQFQVREDLKKNDLHYIDENVQPLVDLIYRRNWGDGREIGKFQMDKSDPVNVQERINVIDLGYRCGLNLKRSNFEELGLEFDEEQQFITRQQSILEYPE